MVEATHAAAPQSPRDCGYARSRKKACGCHIRAPTAFNDTVGRCHAQDRVNIVPVPGCSEVVQESQCGQRVHILALIANSSDTTNCGKHVNEAVRLGKIGAARHGAAAPLVSAGCIHNWKIGPNGACVFSDVPSIDSAGHHDVREEHADAFGREKKNGAITCRGA